MISLRTVVFDRFVIVIVINIIIIIDDNKKNRRGKEADP